mmetsp:Transcript_82509/g.133805  ORF Transcript_82509/g.133805 Transcript_82509/m.133805 type:complete len:200 (+) Transcript_82509:455-1054(+)
MCGFVCDYICTYVKWLTYVYAFLHMYICTLQISARDICMCVFYVYRCMSRRAYMFLRHSIGQKVDMARDNPRLRIQHELHLQELGAYVLNGHIPATSVIKLRQEHEISNRCLRRARSVHAICRSVAIFEEYVLLLERFKTPCNEMTCPLFLSLVFSLFLSLSLSPFEVAVGFCSCHCHSCEGAHILQRLDATINQFRHF